LIAKVLKFPTPAERLEKKPGLFKDLCWLHHCPENTSFKRVWILSGEKCPACGGENES